VRTADALETQARAELYETRSRRYLPHLSGEPNGRHSLSRAFP